MSKKSDDSYRQTRTSIVICELLCVCVGQKIQYEIRGGQSPVASIQTNQQNTKTHVVAKPLIQGIKDGEDPQGVSRTTPVPPGVVQHGVHLDLKLRRLRRGDPLLETVHTASSDPHQITHTRIRKHGHDDTSSFLIEIEVVRLGLALLSDAECGRYSVQRDVSCSGEIGQGGTSVALEFLVAHSLEW